MTEVEVIKLFCVASLPLIKAVLLEKRKEKRNRQRPGVNLKSPSKFEEELKWKNVD